MQRTYTFTVTFYEGSDEFWEGVQNPEDVRTQLLSILDDYGFAEGDDVVVALEKTNEGDAPLYEVADALHMAQFTMGELVRKFNALPDDLRALLLKGADTEIKNPA